MSTSFWTKKRTGPQANLAFLILGCLSALVMAWIRRESMPFLVCFLGLSISLAISALRFARANRDSLTADKWPEENSPK